jgi:DNA-binding NarL/FixJ family response regulator
MVTMIQILLADDHAIMRRGLRGLLETHDGWHVCGEAGNGREAVGLAVDLKPDVVVLDLSMPELNGLEAASQIRSTLPETEILIFTMHESEELIREALSAGVRAVVVKSDVEGHLIAAVESVLKHNVYFSPTVSETLRNALIRSPEDTGSSAPTVALTERELEVTRLLAEGKSNKEVATALSITTRTVETHRANIMRKLEINSIVELVHYAVRNKLVSP